jgi:nicotinamide riboside kinase
MNFKVAFTGTHSVGKTTASLELITELKKRGFNADLVSEAARSCPFPINEITTGQSQMWIFAEMIRREMECKADILVCDRTLLDVVAYTRRVDERYASMMRAFVRLYIPTYDMIFYMEPKSEYFKSDGVRSTDRTFQREIKELIELELKEMNLKVYHEPPILTPVMNGDSKFRLEAALRALEDYASTTD